MMMTCVICLDRLKSDGATLVNCGHVFHHKCLTRWIDQARCCPTCRARTSRTSIIKLFFEESDNHVDVNEVLRKYEKLKTKLKSKNMKIKALSNENNEMRGEMILIKNDLLSRAAKSEKPREIKKAKKRKRRPSSGTIILNDSPPSSPSVKKRRKARTFQ